jgi:4-amino-4-deoxy-L-arabinose transferase-like glycosyltransferase
VRALLLIIVLVASGLRLALAWVNPPQNAHDDHFEVVDLILRNGEVPRKDACFECYHPPVFYVSMAVVARAAGALGVDARKAAQLANCALGVLAVWVLYLIAQALPVSPAARGVALAFIALQPASIYASAMFSNDVAAQLFMTVAAYLLLRVMMGDRRWLTTSGLTAATLAGLFTKYTALALLPGIAAALALLAMRRVPRPQLARVGLAFLVPALALGAAMVMNVRDHGVPLPSNRAIYDPATDQARDAPGGIELLTFKPWQFVAHPQLAPGQLDSFWTVLNASAWFDVHPRFLVFGGDRAAWARFYAWLRGSGPYSPSPVSPTHMALGSCLEILGLCALALAATGAASVVQRRCLDDVPVLTVTACSIAGIVLLARMFPVFSSLKAAYLLGALPGFGMLLARGAEALARWRAGAVGIVVLAAAFAVASVVHLAWCVALLT